VKWQQCFNAQNQPYAVGDEKEGGHDMCGLVGSSVIVNLISNYSLRKTQ